MAMESSTSPPNTTLVTSPAFHEALSQLRDRSLPSPKVRALVTTMSTIIAAQATASLPADSTIALIVILRAGLAMSSPFLDTVEANTTVDGAEGAKVVVYHLGLFRDKKTLEPVEYYNKLPVKHAKITHAFVVDPLIATGGSIMASIAILKDWGISHITILAILASREGLERVSSVWPECTDFYIGAVDNLIDAKGYVSPGVGDIGDRLFGTDLV